MKVRLYSDGSSKGNPGPGGYGTILEYTDPNGQLYTREYSQGYKDTTNNRMEIMGVVRGLMELTVPCEVEVITDSKYVTDTFNQHWIDKWLKTGWKRGTVSNIDLWKKLLEVMEPHDVTFTWVKGHAGHPQNERCDSLATAAAQEIMQGIMIE